MVRKKEFNYHMGYVIVTYVFSSASDQNANYHFKTICDVINMPFSHKLAVFIFLYCKSTFVFHFSSINLLKNALDSDECGYIETKEY